MNEQIQTLRSLWGRSLVETVSADKLIAAGKGYLLGVDYVPAADGDNAVLRDGTDVNAPIISAYIAEGTQAFVAGFPFPRPFTKGLFVDVVTGMTYITVHYVLDRALDE